MKKIIVCIYFILAFSFISTLSAESELDITEKIENETKEEIESNLNETTTTKEDEKLKENENNNSNQEKSNKEKIPENNKE